MSRTHANPSLFRSSSYTREDGTEQPAARALAKGVWRHWTSGTGLGEGVEEFGELGEGETGEELVFEEVWDGRQVLMDS